MGGTVQREYIAFPRQSLTEDEARKIDTFLADIDAPSDYYLPRRLDDLPKDKRLEQIYADIEAIRRTDKVHLVWKYPEPSLQFDLGVAFALNKTIKIINAQYVPGKPGEKKSFDLVVIHLTHSDDGFIERSKQESSDAVVNENSVYMICPVRQATDPMVQVLRNRKSRWAEKGIAAHYPGDDTNQIDSEGGINICRENGMAILHSNGIDVLWGGSTGSLFDLGIAFALGKDIVSLHSIKSDQGTAVIEPISAGLQGPYVDLMVDAHRRFVSENGTAGMPKIALQE